MELQGDKIRETLNVIIIGKQIKEKYTVTVWIQRRGEDYVDIKFEKGVKDNQETKREMTSQNDDVVPQRHR